MKTQLLFLPLLCMTFGSCAQTVLYRDGKPIARMQGDMEDVDYSDGDVRLKAKSINHSAATLAQGKAAQGKIGTLGTALATVGAAAALR